VDKGKVSVIMDRREIQGDELAQLGLVGQSGLD
jgi:hypothetical protein